MNNSPDSEDDDFPDDDNIGNRLPEADGNTLVSGSAGNTRPVDQQPVFSDLDPNTILSALDSVGYRTDGRVNALNSYENRVYQVGLEEAGPVVAKFYRPQRWTDEAILEEHAFVTELAAVDIPAVGAEPSPSDNGQNTTLLHNYSNQALNYRFSVYPLAGGRPPELDNPEQLEVIGRTLGRLHNVGELSEFHHRGSIDAARLGDESMEVVLHSGFLPPHLESVYEGLVQDSMRVVHQRFADLNQVKQIRLHGDFHPGNILWGADETPHILDLDDCCSGPSIQDLWMFISGDRAYKTARLADLLEGYTQFRKFDKEELGLIEPLRCLRQIHYAAWIAKRWQDPAFSQAFPFFAEARFWDEHILSLREQRAALDEAPLKWD